MPVTATVAANLQAAPHLRKLTLEAPAGWTFSAGQFVILPVPPRPQDAKPPKGFYSVASAPGLLPRLELLVEHRPDGGHVSGWVSALQPGQRVEMEGPLGHFGAHAGEAGACAFLGTRAGLAPLRSLILDGLAKGQATPHHLFLGHAPGEEPLLDAEWRSLAAVNAHFHYHPSADPAEALLAALPAPGGVHAYLAGFSRDVEPMRARLLQAGFPEAALKMEKFG